MTDTSDSPAPQEGGTTWTCAACHCRVHRELELCPECGAAPEETVAPCPSRGFHLVMALLLLGILAGALALLSRNRDAAREAELARTMQLAYDPESSLIEDPVQEAPPTPSPEPTPLPPTPTPPPFNPADLGLPTPRPRVVPRATAVPTRAPSTPTPTPVPSMLEIKDQLKKEMRTNLDQRLPLAKPGEQVVLTLRSNRTLQGTLLRTDARQFQLQTASGAQWFPYRQLVQESRLRVDASERETWLEERALKEVLNRL